jgi:hypothetical protein
MQLLQADLDYRRLSVLNTVRKTLRIELAAIGRKISEQRSGFRMSVESSEKFETIRSSYPYFRVKKGP